MVVEKDGDFGKVDRPREVSGSLSQLTVVRFGAKARNDGLSLGARQDRWELKINAITMSRTAINRPQG